MLLWQWEKWCSVYFTSIYTARFYYGGIYFRSLIIYLLSYLDGNVYYSALISFESWQKISCKLNITQHKLACNFCWKCQYICCSKWCEVVITLFMLCEDAPFIFITLFNWNISSKDVAELCNLDSIISFAKPLYSAYMNLNIKGIVIYPCSSIFAGRTSRMQGDLDSLL